MGALSDPNLNRWKETTLEENWALSGICWGINSNILPQTSDNQLFWPGLCAIEIKNNMFTGLFIASFHPERMENGVFGIFGHIWHIWVHIWARAIWSSGVSLKRSCKMQFRRVGLRSIGPSSQKLWPNQIFGRFPHCNYNVKLKMACTMSFMGL